MSTTILQNLSLTLGTTEAALRLVISCLAGFPLAVIYRNTLHGKSPIIQHFYFIITGLLLGYWNYAWDILNVVYAVGASYAVLFAIGGTALSVAIVFIGNLSFLLYGYYSFGTENYDINWTMPQCVLVLRLIGAAYDIYDGYQPLDQLSADAKKTAISQIPSIFEFFAHQLFPASVIVGPQFPLRRYLDYIDGKFNGSDGGPPDSVQAAIRRAALGFFYIIIFQLCGLFVSDAYIYSDDYAQLGFIKKLFLMGIWGRFTLYKYISCWLLTEGACIMFGITHNGVNENGEIQWDGCENVKLKIFENTTEFNHYIKSFNINTNHWVAKYIYKRLKFLGNRHISQLASLVFLAIWHGFHSGYYLTFFFEFIVVHMERDVKSIVKHNQGLSTFFGNPYLRLPIHILLRLYTFIFMGWCLFPFALLTYDKYWKAFNAVDHIGTVLYVFWPIIYSPLLKTVFKRDRAITKEQ